MSLTCLLTAAIALSNVGTTRASMYFLDVIAFTSDSEKRGRGGPGGLPDEDLLLGVSDTTTGDGESGNKKVILVEVGIVFLRFPRTAASTRN